MLGLSQNYRHYRKLTSVNFRESRSLSPEEHLTRESGNTHYARSSRGRVVGSPATAKSCPLVFGLSTAYFRQANWIAIK